LTTRRSDRVTSARFSRVPVHTRPTAEALESEDNAAWPGLVAVILELDDARAIAAFRRDLAVVPLEPFQPEAL
jgi:hypothetical protein